MKNLLSTKITKSILVLSIICIGIIMQKNAFAASPSPTSSSQPESTVAAELDKIQKIKEMVASKVAELNLVEKRGLLGTVKETGTTQLTIVDSQNTERVIDTDELTKFSGLTSSKTFGISDIKAGDLVSAIGLYNKDTEHLLGRFISEQKPLPIQFEGKVVQIDDKNYEITIENNKGDQKTAEVETTTKTRSFAKDEGTSSSGFSKIEMSQRILVTGYSDPKDGNKIVADRIIHFTDIPAYLNPNVSEKNSTSSAVSVQPTK